MLHTALLALLATVLAHVLADQVLLFSGQPPQDEHHPMLDAPGHEDFTEWSLGGLPDPNATDHLVFETVHSLLQHWPNTRMRNGHNIVPAIIPTGTLLYHGRPDNELPKGPGWVATDPEHSYVFTRNVVDRTQQGGWHLTLVTTRPLKTIYFDGNSAAKLYGPLDTQDLIIWGKIGDGNIFEDEARRIQALCEWGKNFGVDGIVRMQMDFEIMLCDFEAGVGIVSFEHLASKWSDSFVFSGTEAFEVMNAGAWHNRFPGETRIQLDLPGLVSFYDTQLAPSLVPIRVGLERWDHRAINISSEDMLAVKSRLEANLLRHDSSSTIDWKTLIQVVVDRYADRLELTRYLVSSPAADPDEVLDLAKKAQAQLRTMLTPYILLSAAPTNPLDKTELDWTIPIYKRCGMTHTLPMKTLFARMTDSEKLLLQAVKGTSREICRVVTKMWAAGVYAGIDPSLNTKGSPDIAEVTYIRDTWAHEVERLMAWLDWSSWVKCNPGCGFEETCYLPTWPIGFPWLVPDSWPAPFPPSGDYAPPAEKMSSFTLRATLMKRAANDLSNIVKPEPDEWIRPQPKCIRRVRPYGF